MITKFEPHLEAKVRKSGDIYVGRQHIGKTAYIYFVRENTNGTEEECEKGERDTVQDEKGDIRG